MTRFLQIFFASALCLLSTETWAQESKEKLLSKIEAYLNTHKTLEADFQQLNHNGDLYTGKFYLSRPGKMRFSYTNPKTQQMISNGTWLVHHDTSTDEKTFLALNETPAEFILRDPITFRDGVKVASIEETGKVLKVTLRKSDEPELGTLTLTFNKDPLSLIQWIVVDAQRLKTVVNLENLKTNVVLDQTLFEIPESWCP